LNFDLRAGVAKGRKKRGDGVSGWRSFEASERQSVGAVRAGLAERGSVKATDSGKNRR